MSRDGNLSILQNILTESVEYITPLLKSLNHQKRYQIMISLLDSPKSFGFFKKELNISKTALANHLSYLVKSNLIIKLYQGMYKLTQDGEDLLKTIGDIYQRSKLRTFQRQRSIQKQYKRGYSRLKYTKHKQIPNKPVFVKSEISFLGACMGVLTSLNLKLEKMLIGGYSGYSFIVNVAKDRFCPSGSVAFTQDVWKEIRLGVEDFSGYKLKVIGDKKPYPKNHPLDEEDKKRAFNLFNKIKKEIELNDQPVILWGGPIPEYGIVYGYEGENYLCSTYRHLMGISESPIPYYSLQAPGSLHAIVFRKKEEKMIEKLDYKAIIRACDFLANSKPEVGYSIGIEAYKEWANVLENATIDELSYHGNSRMGAILLEANKISQEFLAFIAKRQYNTKQEEHLVIASKEFSKIKQLLMKFNTIFPSKLEGKIDESNRRKGSNLLLEAIPHLQYVKDSLERAVNLWE